MIGGRLQALDGQMPPSSPLLLPRYGPRERLLHLGEERLSAVECLALILRTGNRGESAEALAVRLLAHFGGLSGVAGAGVRELALVRGVGPVRAAALRAAFGLARRLVEERASPGRQLAHGGDVARVVRESARGSHQECFFALMLDVRHRILGLRVISRGTLALAPVHPRDVFVAAIREGAAAVVIAHNHPSGDAAPSREDRDVTDRLREAGALLGIAVLDHVVVGAERFFSFADEAFHQYE